MSGRFDRWARAVEALSLCLVVALFVTLFRDARPVMLGEEPIARDLHLLPDSRQYLTFAEAIATGELFRVEPGRPVPQHLVMRMPGYPALLAFAAALVPGDAATRITVLHGAIGLATLVGVPLLVRAWCPVAVTAPALLFVLWRMRVYFGWAITEWTSLNLLLFLFAASVRYWSRPSTAGLFGLGALAAALILVRPAMAVVGLVPAAAALAGVRAVGLRVLPAVVGPFVPVLLWMAFNVHRLGTFALTPSLGHNLFGVASMVGHAEAAPGDDEDLRLLIEEVNRGKQPPPGRRLAIGSAGRAPFAWEIERLAGVYRRNVHRVAEDSVRRHGWDMVRYNAMLLEYSLRAIRRDPRAYLDYVLFGLRSLRSVVPLLLPALVVPAVWLWRGTHRGLAIATLSMLVIHLLHTLLCAMVEVVLPRYYRLTWFPLVAASIVATAVLVRSVAGRPRAAP